MARAFGITTASQNPVEDSFYLCRIRSTPAQAVYPYASLGIRSDR